MKDNLQEIEEGDLVILLANSALSLKKVVKVTSTQIHLENRKYRKDGSEITPEKWCSTIIFAPMSKPKYSDKAWFESYNEQQQKLKLEKKTLISEINAVDLTKLPISSLKEVLKLLKGNT